MATIKEVAVLAGTSTATVSRALAQPTHVSAVMYLKVQEAVRQTGYTPNLLARNLRRMESRSTLVLLPDIANPFFPEVVLGMEEVAHLKGYCVLLGDTKGAGQREQAYAEMLLSRQADGLIVLGGRVPELLMTKLISKTGSLPIVIACERIRGVSLPTVLIDNVAAAFTATWHLIDLGHRRIGFITGPSGNVLTKDRLAGYRKALTAAHIPIDATLVAAGDFSIAAGITATTTLLALPTRPTALVASNDEMALGALHGAKRIGLRIPEDLSIVGFDDIRFSAVCDPPLTTISQPRQEIGRRAMNLLLEHLANPGSAPVEIVLEANLVVRSSTGPGPGSSTFNCSTGKAAHDKSLKNKRQCHRRQ